MQIGKNDGVATCILSYNILPEVYVSAEVPDITVSFS